MTSLSARNPRWTGLLSSSLCQLLRNAIEDVLAGVALPPRSVWSSLRSRPALCQRFARTHAQPSAIDSLSMCSASEPALFRCGCMMGLQCHLLASVRRLVLNIRFSECLSSVMAFRFHDQAHKSVLDAAHDDRVQHERSILSLIVWREIGQQEWHCSSRHVICNFSEAWVNCCEIRNELESPIVVFFVLPYHRSTMDDSGVEDPRSS